MIRNNFYYVVDDNSREELLTNFKIEVGNRQYERVSYRVWCDLCNTDEWEIFIDDHGLHEASPVEIYQYNSGKPLYIGDTEDDSFGEFIANWFHWMPYEEPPQQTYKINLPKNDEKKEKDNMKMFGNFEFGSCEKDGVRLSPYGIAVKNAAGVYVSYKADTGEVIDVDIANFNGGKYLYKLPVAFKDVKVGDVIIHNRKPHFVTEVKEGNITAIDVCEAEEKRVIPISNMFGFNFVTKVVSLLDGMLTKPSEDQPFGNLLPFMLMNESGNSNDLLPLLLFSQGNANINPLMLYALADNKGGNDLLPLLLLSGGFNAPNVSSK